MIKFKFIDFENIGLKELEKIESSVLDKTFVFTKSQSAKLLCKSNLYQVLSDYPTGQNQADFLIIAQLAKVLSMISRQEINKVQFYLYSNDESLISAFEFQCQSSDATFKVIRTKQNVVQLKKAKATPEKLLLDALSSPQNLSLALQESLGLARSDFTRAINQLAQSKEIVKCKDSKKKWVRKA